MEVHVLMVYVEVKKKTSILTVTHTLRQDFVLGGGTLSLLILLIMWLLWELERHSYIMINNHMNSCAIWKYCTHYVH